MRTPEPTDRSSAARPPAGLPPDSRNGSSSVVPLRPSAEPPTGPDDAPTIITTPRPAVPSDPSLGLAAGSKLGHFEVIGSVGVGGMAAVLKARDLELGRDVALKILPPHMARDPENVTRFKQEARAAAKLDHDNIARVFFCGEDRGLHFIAFEFVEGDNLRAVIDRRGPLPPAECVRYLIQVAAGLAHAAGRGVVHRDIKPSNILVTPDGKAKIVDMGLARNLHQSVNGGVTQSGVTLGTFDYISPEQALDPRRADVRSDIYSLGCAFYHALTGRPPVPEGTAAKKLFAHQHDPVLDPRVLNPQVPDELAAVLSRMMAKNPAHRYQTPAELIAMLTAVARRLNLSTDAMPALDPGLAPPDPSAVRVLPQPPRLPVGLVIGVAAVAVAAVVVFGLPGANRDVRPPFPPDPARRAGATGEPAPVPAAPAPHSPSGVQTAHRVEDLAHLLADPAVTEVRLEANKTYDLTTLPAGVLVQGKPSVALVGNAGAEPPVVRVAAGPASADRHAAPPAGTLTIDQAKTVRLQGVRFDVTDAPLSEVMAERQLGVLVSDSDALTVSECRFHADPALTVLDTAGLAVVRDTAKPRTEVTVHNCYFGLRRGVAVQLVGSVKAAVRESAFDRHPTVFALRGESAGAERSELDLTHCTFLLDRGAVADAAEEARWAVSAGFCVFAAVPQDPAAVMMGTSPDDPLRKPVVLRLPGDTAAARFTGTGDANAYYHTDAAADSVRGYTFDEARQWPNAPPAVDSAAVELTQSPWASADPAAELDRRPEPGRRDDPPWKAFRLKTSLPQLRAPNKEVMLGVRSLPREGDRIYSTWPPPVIEGAAANPQVKVWWPDPPAADRDRSLPPYHFTSLKDAVAALKPGDQLQIRHTGVLPVPQVALESPRLRVTIRPYPGTRPILEPDTGRALDAALFKLAEGELTLDGLEIRLHGPADRPGDVRSRSAVTVVAGRRCVLQNCVVTCEEQDDEKMAVVVLADANGEARADADRRPEVRLENCLVRGRGRAVWVTASRPFDLALTNTTTALAGPVIAVDAAAHATATGTVARVKLTRVTAALAGSLLDLRPGRPSPGRPAGWVPLEVLPERCLFAPVERNHPLVTIDGGDPTYPDRTFTWAPALPGPPNWYANYLPMATFLEVVPADRMVEPQTLDSAGWFRRFRERADRSTGTVKFERPPETTQKLATIQPADLAVRSVQIPGAMASEAGADVKQLPTPADAAPGER
jgi:tRNA A-37 threonylcarbamoyl transferase component Bud32